VIIPVASSDTEFLLVGLAAHGPQTSWDWTADLRFAGHAGGLRQLISAGNMIAISEWDATIRPPAARAAQAHPCRPGARQLAGEGGGSMFGSNPRPSVRTHGLLAQYQRRRYGVTVLSCSLSDDQIELVAAGDGRKLGFTSADIAAQLHDRLTPIAEAFLVRPYPISDSTRLVIGENPNDGRLYTFCRASWLEGRDLKRLRRGVRRSAPVIVHEDRHRTSRLLWHPDDPARPWDLYDTPWVDYGLKRHPWHNVRMANAKTLARFILDAGALLIDR
jgi:hypothetical protein